MADNETFGLEFIPNQPIIFDLEQDACRTILDGGYCQPFKSSTDIELQMKRKPCGDNLDCLNPSESYDANSVVNGTFDTDLASWTTGGDLWVWAAGAATPSFGGVGWSEIYQTVTVVPGTHRIRVDVTAGAGGTLVFMVDGQLYYNDNTTETIEVFVTTESTSVVVGFISTAPWDGTIDNVTVERQYYDCYDGPAWVYDPSEGYYQHLTGTAVSLLSVTPFLLTGSWYEITLSVRNRTTGGGRLIAGDNASEWLYTNGVHKRYLYTGSTNVSGFEPESDFDGQIKIESIYLLSTPSQIDLVDATDTSIIMADLLPYHTLDGGRINLKFNYDQLLADGALASEDAPPRCFRIAVDSVCAPIGSNMVTNGNFDGGSGSSITGWTGINAPWMGVFDFNNIQVERASGEPLGPKWRNQTNPLMTAGDYLLVFNLTKNDDTDNIAVRFLLEGVAASPWFTAIANLQNYLFTGFVPNPGTGVNHQCLVMEYGFAHDGVLTTGQIAVDTVRLFKMTSSVQPKISNCIVIKPDAEMACHKMMEGRSSCLNHGFDFRNFTLRLFAPFLKWGATYPGKDTAYTYSDGTNDRVHSERDKIHQAKIDRVDEITHDALSVMLLQEEFKIDGREFFFKGKYTPQHDKSGLFNQSRATFELSEPVSVVYGNRCADCEALTTAIECLDACQASIGLAEGEPVTEGWYHVPDAGELWYWNGAEWEFVVTCTGYIYYNGHLLIFNDVLGEWVEFIQMVVTGSGTGELTITSTIPASCAAQVLISYDNGGEWENLSTMYTAAQWAAGIDFTEPSEPYWLLLRVRCGSCTYDSFINTDYGA